MREDVLSPPGCAERAEVRSYTGADGRTLRYRVVCADPQRHALVYLHGIESHGDWFLSAAHALAEHGCTTYLVDRRGSGLNRELASGDAPSARVLLEDVRRFRAHAGLASVVLVGLSWGGKLAVAAALDQKDGVRGLVLITPGLVPLVDLSRGTKVLLALSLLIGGRARFHVPIEPDMFTRVPRTLRFIQEDPLRLTRVTGRFLLASRTLDRMIEARVRELDRPVLLLLAGHDRIVDNERTRCLLERLPPGRLRVRIYDQATHSIQLDETEELVSDVFPFLEEVE